MLKSHSNVLSSVLSFKVMQSLKKAYYLKSLKFGERKTGIAIQSNKIIKLQKTMFA